MDWYVIGPISGFNSKLYLYRAYYINDDNARLTITVDYSLLKTDIEPYAVRKVYTAELQNPGEGAFYSDPNIWEQSQEKSANEEIILTTPEIIELNYSPGTANLIQLNSEDQATLNKITSDNYYEGIRKLNFKLLIYHSDDDSNYSLPLSLYFVGYGSDSNLTELRFSYLNQFKICYLVLRKSSGVWETALYMDASIENVLPTYFTNFSLVGVSEGSQLPSTMVDRIKNQNQLYSNYGVMIFVASYNVTGAGANYSQITYPVSTSFNYNNRRMELTFISGTTFYRILADSSGKVTSKTTKSLI